MVDKVKLIMILLNFFTLANIINKKVLTMSHMMLRINSDITATYQIMKIMLK